MFLRVQVSLRHTQPINNCFLLEGTSLTLCSRWEYQKYHDHRVKFSIKSCWSLFRFSPVVVHYFPNLHLTHLKIKHTNKYSCIPWLPRNLKFVDRSQKSFQLVHSVCFLLPKAGICHKNTWRHSGVFGQGARPRDWTAAHMDSDIWLMKTQPSCCPRVGNRIPDRSHPERISQRCYWLLRRKWRMATSPREGGVCPLHLGFIS